MGWSDAVTKGGEQKVYPPRLFVYGPGGVGKSTLGSKLPRPIFIDIDRGIDEIRVDRMKETPKTWADTLKLVREIAASPSGYESLVLDTVDPLEEMCMEHVSKEAGKTFQAMNDQFGAGYVAVANEWKVLLAEFDIARKNGMLVCLLAHATIRQSQDPTLGTFDQWTSLLGKKTWALVQRWSDLVAFASFDASLAVRKDDARLIVTGDRVLTTMRSTGVDGAKNRFSLPEKLPLDWPALRLAIEAHRQSSTELRVKILKLAAGTPYEGAAKDYLETAGDDLSALLEIEANLTKAIQAPPAAPVTTAATAAPAPAPVQEPARQSPEAIELRIFELAKGHPELEAKAKSHVTNAGKDLVMLLKIEEALTAKVQELRNGAARA
jgi:hypothetical protein